VRPIVDRPGHVVADENLAGEVPETRLLGSPVRPTGPAACLPLPGWAAARKPRTASDQDPAARLSRVTLLLEPKIETTASSLSDLEKMF
jgi:hypothetical protein